MQQQEIQPQTQTAKTKPTKDLTPFEGPHQVTLTVEHYRSYRHNSKQFAKGLSVSDGFPFQHDCKNSYLLFDLAVTDIKEGLVAAWVHCPYDSKFEERFKITAALGDRAVEFPEKFTDIQIITSSTVQLTREMFLTDVEFALMVETEITGLCQAMVQTAIDQMKAGAK